MPTEEWFASVSRRCYVYINEESDENDTIGTSNESFTVHLSVLSLIFDEGLETVIVPVMDGFGWTTDAVGHPSRDWSHTASMYLYYIWYDLYMIRLWICLAVQLSVGSALRFCRTTAKTAMMPQNSNYEIPKTIDVLFLDPNTDSAWLGRCACHSDKRPLSAESPRCQHDRYLLSVVR